MNFHHLPSETVLLVLFKLLKTFGLIPGAIAANWVRKQVQKWKQNRAIEGWPATDATIQSGQVQKQGLWSYWAEVTYTYYVDEYRVGKYVRHFRREDHADDFVREIKDKRVHVHYEANNPDKSVILDRDLEMIALLAPQYR